MKKMFYLLLITTTIIFDSNSYAQENQVKIKVKRNQDNSTDVFYEKSVPGNYTIRIEFSNVSNSYPQDFEDVVEHSSGLLLTIKPNDKNQPISFNYSSWVQMGNLKPKVDSLFVYTLPFRKEKIVTSYESNNLYHDILNAELPKNWVAYQFRTINADTIFAARKGIVVALVDHFETDTIALVNTKNNYIMIEHADGTLASYTGFAKKKMLVKLGQTVYPQTPIGIIKESFRAIPNNFFFNVFYLFNDKSKNRNKNSNSKWNVKQAFVRPYFLTENGIKQLEAFEKYQVTIDPIIIQKEMTKSEKKKINKPK